MQFRKHERDRHKVAIIGHYFPHYRTATFEQLAGISGNKYYFLADTEDPQNAGIKPSPIVNHPNFRRLRAWKVGKLFLQPGLLKWAMSAEVDTWIVVAVPHGLFYWFAPLIARLFGKRVIFWTIGWIQDDRGFKNFLRRTFYSLANSLLIYGHYGKILGMQRGIPATSMHVVYNALDYDTQRNHRDRLTDYDLEQTKNELFGGTVDPILVCCSRLLPHRKLEHAIESLAILKSRGININLLLVGEGSERAKLQSMADRLGVNVYFFGACYDEATLSRLIASSDLTIAPGMVGLTAMQSLAYGTPVITHDDPYHQAPESDCLTPGLTGQFFEYGNVGDIADKLEDWFFSQRDIAACRRACREIIEKFYNPVYQAKVIERAVNAIDADDLFLLKDRLLTSQDDGVSSSEAALEQQR
jgi:glycosyltransferase involved in cell wall biosynthesis